MSKDEGTTMDDERIWSFGGSLWLDDAEHYALRVGFITAAYDKGARDEDIMRHIRHRDLRTMRGYVQHTRLVTESPTSLLDL